MEIINKTPLTEEDGSLSFINRIRGTLKFGFSWYPDLLAQESAIAIMGKILDSQFVLLRNPVLGAAKVTFPLILVGPPGVMVIYVTHLDGMYRAKGDMWGKIENGRFKPASVNLLQRTAKLAKALGVYLHRIDPTFRVPPVDAVLLATDPGMHIESIRPIVRIVLSDAIERFALSLTQMPPALDKKGVQTVVEMILTGKKPEEAFEFSSGASSLGMGEIAFDFEDDEDEEEETPQAEPVQPQSKPKPKTPPSARRAAQKKSANGLLGLTPKQWTILAVLAGAEICALVMMILIVVFQLQS